MDTRTVRRLETRRSILDAAWALADRDGIASWTLRDLAADVGMRAPSLFTHFDGRDAILDALFAEGWALLAEHLDALPPRDLSPTEQLIARTEALVDFCTASPARYQLMFTHVLGGWEPTPEAYAVSRQTWEAMVAGLAGAGVTDPRHLDLFASIGAGIVAQQVANDLGGDRYRRLVAEAVDMFLSHVRTATTQ